MQHQCVFQLLLYCQNGRMRGGQIGRGDKAYSPVIARYEAIPNFTDGYVSAPAEFAIASSFLLAMTIFQKL